MHTKLIQALLLGALISLGTAPARAQDPTPTEGKAAASGKEVPPYAGGWGPG